MNINLKKPVFKKPEINLQNLKKMGNLAKISVLAIMLIILLLGSVYKLDSGWNAVVLRFGELQKVETQSGFHFKLPIIDKAMKVNMAQVQKLEYGYSTVVEGGKNRQPEYEDNYDEAMVIVDAKGNNSSVVLINLVVRYKVDNPVDYFFKVDDLEGTLRLALEDVIRNTIQIYSLNEALTNKAVIDAEILPEIQKRMSEYEAGIKVVEVKTQNTMLMPEVNKAYEAVEEANQYKNGKLQEAMQKKNTVIPQAEAEYTKMLEEAKGYKAQVLAKARASVSQYEALYLEYQKNPNIVKEKYYIEAMSEFMKNNKVIVDLSKDQGVFKYYNLQNDLPAKLDMTNGK